MTQRSRFDGAARPCAALALAAALTALALAGCGTEGDIASSAFVAPGQYVLFQCDDIDRAAKGAVARRKELEGLMTKAGTSPAGQLIGEATYGPELATIRGRLRDLRAAAKDKNCNFVPGESPPTPPPPAATKR